MADLCIGILLISTLTLTAVSVSFRDPSPWHSFGDRYLFVQSEAMVNGERRETEAEDDAGTVIVFNALGNITQARTLHFTGRGGRRDVVIELGGGRLVFRET